MINSRHVVIIICIAGLFLLTGCKKTDNQSQPVGADDQIVCPLLYQGGGSLSDALAFIGVPDDRMESSLSSVNQRGELPDQSQLMVANKIISLCESRDSDLFVSLLSDGTKAKLDDDNRKRMLHYHLRAIEEGTFLDAEADSRFFATVRRFTDDDRDKLKKHISFPETPTHIMTVYHFNKPMYMLAGTSFYLLEDKDSYKVVTETLLQGELPDTSGLQQEQRAVQYGIVSFEQNDNAYDRTGVWKYQWKVEINPAETANSNFEMLKLTEIISIQGHNDIHPDVAKQMLVKYDVFDKYKYKQLKFMFRIGDQGLKDNFSKYEQTLSGLDCSVSIASIGLSTWMYFPGSDMKNAKVHKDSGFNGSDLEFISFETEKDGVKYRTRVVLRKNPVRKKQKLLIQPTESL